MPFTRQSVDSEATGFGAVQWDVATLKQIRITKEMNYDDAFTIEEVYSLGNLIVHLIHILQVDPRLIEKFNAVAEVIPVIKAYVKEVGMLSSLLLTSALQCS